MQAPFFLLVYGFWGVPIAAHHEFLFFALFSFHWRFRHLRTLSSPKAPWARWCTFKSQDFARRSLPIRLVSWKCLHVCSERYWWWLSEMKVKDIDGDWAAIRSSTMVLMRARWPNSWLAKILFLTASAFFFQAGPPWGYCKVTHFRTVFIFVHFILLKKYEI